MENPFLSTPYALAEQYLLGLVNYEKAPPPMRGDEAGWHLVEFQRLLDRMGNPERGLPIIHIAGTKGKGSTTFFLVELLKGMGVKRVGSFISPHIEFFRERICVDNRPVSEEEFVRLLDQTRRHLPTDAAKGTEGFRTTFEVLTAMALREFADQKCEAVVLETGLGGRLDCTNVPMSRIAVITSIGFDHMKVLGDTIEEIAFEKAGIIKPGVRAALLARQSPEHKDTVTRVFVERAMQTNVPYFIGEASREPIPEAVPFERGFRVSLDIGADIQTDLEFPQLGRSQINNLRTALEAARHFVRLERPDLEDRLSRLDGALKNCRVPGRLELIGGGPIRVADAAHCPLSARAAVQAMSEHFPGRPVILALGLLRDKGVAGILQELAALPKVVEVFVHEPNSPRALPSAELHGAVKARFQNVEDKGTVERAIDAALESQSRNPNAVLLSTGSFYSLAQARKRLSAAG